MDFKQYYKQQELMEFTGSDTVSKIGSGVGKLIGGAFNLMGAGIKALAGGVAKVVKDMAGKIREPLKKKFDAALALAEEIYPYDKAKYDVMKTNKNSDIEMYLGTAEKKLTSYSVGLDIVYKAYAAVMAEVLKMDIDITNPKLSIKTLDDSKNKVKNVQFPQMKDSKDVDRYFEANWVKDNTMLQKWITNAAFYCMWKNKYNKNDDEGMASIVDQIQKSGTLYSETLQNIDNKMRELEANNQEVNIQNLEEAFKLSVDQKTQLIKDEIIGDKTIITLDQEMKDEIDDEDIKYLSKRFLQKAIEPLTLANTYASMTMLIKHYHRNETIQQIFKNITQFLSFFKAIVPDQNILNGVTVKLHGDNLMNNFINLNGNGVVTGKEKIKMTKQMIEDVNILAKALVAQPTEVKPTTATV